MANLFGRFHPLEILGLLAFSCVAAAAADFPSSTPTLSNAWTGPWVGVYGAGVLADPGGSFSVSAPSFAAFPNVLSTIDAAGSGSISARGGAFGLEAGWNQRTDPNFIVGIEGDLGSYGLRGSRAVAGTIPIFDVPFTINQNVNVNWEAALRLRAGYTPDDLMLAYVEAGPALANVHYVSSFWDAADETEFVSIQSAQFGYSVGAGVEYAVTKNVSLKAEYLFSHFPGVTGTGTSLLTDGSIATVAHSSGAIDQHAFRIGLTYYPN